TLRAATSAFRHFDIPVGWQDARRGRLSSGPFTVEDSWGGESLANRVDCGEEGGRPRVERGIVELRVDLEISTRRVRDGGFLSGGVVGTVPGERGRGRGVARRGGGGEEGGRPSVERGMRELRVGLEVSTRRVRDGGFLRGGVVGTVPVESGRRREGARVSIDSSGRLYTPEGKTHSCRLTMEFAKRVIEYVAQLAGGTHSVP